ncbi:MAG: UTP--glucose-1-phosphate uridylyltransferase [Phycisphaera sp.]|nr:UTP--glucose-1-phosphate uridylyltransferase [Phycisphaera sp.]
MSSRLIPIILADDPNVRDRSLDGICREASIQELLDECDALDALRREHENLYVRVRALFFLYSIHRFHLPTRAGVVRPACIPFAGYRDLLSRRFNEAINAFLHTLRTEGPSDGICSALAEAYHRLGFATLARQVRRSVRTVKGNQWMFRTGHPEDQPLQFRGELLERSPDGAYPILYEATPVRMDLTHSGWSDIFFLGMDYPQGAKVVNVSIDLGLHGRDKAPRPPVNAFLRVIDEPVIRLVSVDLKACSDVKTLAEVFDFARDYLGLLKAALIASGLVPAGLEGSQMSLQTLLHRLVGPGRGFELVSSVNNIPKGSRLAVSTNLLAALISVCMRATRQAHALEGELDEPERRLVLARAILGEWLGGSGGGWQDSGGVWPGMKLIQGAEAKEGDPEFGISRGRLMPNHTLIPCDDKLAKKLQDSLVLVHGGLAQNVGPILEMVAEKYLLRSEAEWHARADALTVLDEVLHGIESQNIQAIGKATTRNFFGPIQTIIPWASTYYTEQLIEKIRGHFGQDFWGFWMLGGMSGGGMGFMFAPKRKSEAQRVLQETMSQLKGQLQHAMPFAMEPVVYDFAINPRGTWAKMLCGDEGLLPRSYYALMAPRWLRTDPRDLKPATRSELQKLARASKRHEDLAGLTESLIHQMLPEDSDTQSGHGPTLLQLLSANGFDPKLHEQVRSELEAGRIGLSQNRLPSTTRIEDVSPGEVTDMTGDPDPVRTELGRIALSEGRVAVVTLAAGAGSRWTQGAGVVKGLHPFAKLSGRHRSFLETHLAKSRKIGKTFGKPVPHVVTTSYLTHDPIEAYLAAHDHYGYEGDLVLSRGYSVGQRMIPMVRDLRFAWEEMPQQVLDEQAQKVRESLRAALIHWARQSGEASDYTDNLPLQCLHPVGHWFEVPNMLRNGVLKQLLKKHPELTTLLLHNIDTVGADLDPHILGQHLGAGNGLTFEVITRRIDDRGGGLARVDGHVRLVEGLAMPREEDEFDLSYYNSATCWIEIDHLLTMLGLSRDDLDDQPRVDAAVRALGRRMPTYVTLKDVKKRWGHGQEDVFPVCQFEKLWGDMTALPESKAGFVVVPRQRGQQIKEQAQLDGWFRDGSADYVNARCAWRD